MSNVVFILGAGASRQAGAPLMCDFLDVSRNLMRKGETADLKGDFERLFKGISVLQQVHSKAELDIHNVESVFAAFEMARILRRFAQYTPSEIDSLLEAVRAVMVYTIERSLKLPVSENQVYAPPPYDQFVRLIRDIEGTTSVLTFNYDMAMDYACYIDRMAVDYGLDEEVVGGSTPLLKLHGSLNWGHCRSCDAVVPWTLPAYFKTYDWSHFIDIPNATLGIGANIGEFKHCDQAVDKVPVLVPPTWNKTEYHRSLASVWSRAAGELSEAEDIFVIGYSLPESDAFFRYLYALGSVGQEPLQRFWVFNPDKSGATKRRFETLLGPGARERFEYHELTFDEAIRFIREWAGSLIRLR